MVSARAVNSGSSIRAETTLGKLWELCAPSELRTTDRHGAGRWERLGTEEVATWRGGRSIRLWRPSPYR
eukprot:890092-Prymnesium_polylepis.1